MQYQEGQVEGRFDVVQVLMCLIRLCWQVISGYSVVEAISRVKTKSENPVRDAARCTTGKFKSRFEV